ncbi:MAG: fibronectin type III domain-containing protein [Flavobacteriales bacterium]|nr:fibronectin type III domain-containing protein [Flavobacteriales bacterium]MBK7248417.1 fibronectin type III domain-containing protein [Flavobacteriales bacterium]MBK7286871.1 fibronectin type III domain-containing protein [Flavobacteriales bacterium]MBK9059373.1 fibronectin type III domain-containing protein [Flavobacteriales bacterium]QQS73670.1 MAG: fibronectin type III domain-containing protein [Flavobacteriales bacterium]
MKANIRLSLSRLNPVSVLVLLRNVISKMTGNANFPTPKVPLADMTTLADNLSLAIDDANAGSLLAKSKRDDLVHSAKEDLNAQADYVRSICGGDRSMLLSSGFELAKERTPIGIPGVPANLFTRMTGKMGQLEVRFDSVHGAHGYQLWMTDKDPELYNSWNAVGYTTRVKHLVTDLESYKAYWFCVSAIGTAGESAQSGPALGRAA